MGYKKIIKIIAAVVIVALAVAAYNKHENNKYNQMQAYAEENNCQWEHDFYLNKAPVCR